MENRKTVREEILAKLKAADRKVTIPRPEMQPLEELSLRGEALIAKFIDEVVTQTGVVHRVPDKHSTLSTLSTIVRSEGVDTVMASDDDVVRALDLPAWGRYNDVNVLNARDFKDRRQFTGAVFEQAQIGITGADFGVAESGTIGLIHHKNQPRLISLAPIHHIAILPIDRLVPVYEQVTDVLFDRREIPPRHFTFITGPSMTGDIQAVPFKGMHGPRRLEVILIE